MFILILDGIQDITNDGTDDLGGESIFGDDGEDERYCVGIPVVVLDIVIVGEKEVEILGKLVGGAEIPG